MNPAAVRTTGAALEKLLTRHGMPDEARGIHSRTRWLIGQSTILQLPTPVWQAFLLPVPLPEILRKTKAVDTAAVRTSLQSAPYLTSSSAVTKLTTAPVKRKQQTSLAALSLLRVLHAITTGDASATGKVSRRQWIQLADHFGMWRMRYLLEDAWLQAEDPMQFDTVRQLLERQERRHQRMLGDIAVILRHALGARGLRDIRIEYRRKNIGGIVEKMRRKGKSINHITDIFAFRIITGTPAQCYAVRDVLHHLWRAYPDKSDDFIAKPKPNGYRSLHSTVRCLKGLPVEFQIRTGEMDWVAKYGPAAHASYKEKARGGKH